MRVFDPSELKKLHQPHWKSTNEDNGQVTIIGGSRLFHGAPILALKTASRIVDMVFFATPEPSVGRVAERVKSKLLSFIWVPWDEVGAYIQKSDAVLIGPGFMRYGKEAQNPTRRQVGQNEDKRLKVVDGEGKMTREITGKLLRGFPEKKWVIDAGSLQVMDAEWIPQNAVLTPNKKEFAILFGFKPSSTTARAGQNTAYRTSRTNLKITSQMLKIVKEKAEKRNCVVVLKGPETIVASPSEAMVVRGGNPGMTKGGTGDVLAGLTVALLAKNDPFLAACAASYVAKKAGEELYEKVGVNYNADDLADKIPEILHKLLID